MPMSFVLLGFDGKEVEINHDIIGFLQTDNIMVML